MEKEFYLNLLIQTVYNNEYVNMERLKEKENLVDYLEEELFKKDINLYCMVLRYKTEAYLITYLKK
jgi:hypothetical protein